MPLLHDSTRRPSALQSSDYDHEIVLVDHTRTSSPAASRSVSANGLRRSPTSDSSSRRHSDVPLYKHQSPLHLRKELTRRKFAKYQDREVHQVGREGDDTEHAGPPDGNDTEIEEEQRGRPRRSKKTTKPAKTPETAIDILYENQRGGFLCGIPLFSSKALGNLDPAPWTNVAQKTSATNPTNAQVPDPSWKWVWKEWSVNKTEEVDGEGWEYAFMFHGKFSWHGPSWYNSFVRRRAWIRKRAKKHAGYQTEESHMMTPDYFTIHSAHVRNRSQGSSRGGSRNNRYSLASMAHREEDEDIDPEDISDIGTLMKALHLARIDREKTEAVESFMKHGGDDLYYLRDHMHDIMRRFIFQASRRALLAHLLAILIESTEQLKDDVDDDKESQLSQRKRIEHLEAAVKCAEEEVRKLEFWSDVKDMAEQGIMQGAADPSQGWGKEWTGLDGSSPRDVLSDPKLSGKADCADGESHGEVEAIDKGKDKELDG